MKKTDQLKKRFFIIDVAAILVLAALAIGYYNICTHSVNVVDESCYILFAHRFYLGDQPIVDEWHVAQMTGILLLLPFSAFYSVTHSTEGVVLFFRLLYTVCQMLVTAYIYISLRIYGNRKYSRLWERRIFAFGALIAAAVFACFIPAWIPTLSYYSMSLMGLAVLSITMFCYPAGKYKYLFCGIVFAAVVIAEPISFLLYPALTLLLLLIKLVNRLFHKRFAQVLFQNRVWLYFTLGGCIIAFSLTVFLLHRCGLKPLIDSFHHIFDGAEYVFSGDRKNVFSFDIFQKVIALYGTTALWMSVILTGLAAVLYRFRRYTRPFFLLGMCVCLTLAYIHAWHAKEGVTFDSIILFHGIPLYLCAPLLMLLTTKPDKRMCCGWVCCALFSVVFSVASAISVGWGGIAAGVFSVMLISQIVIESLHAFSSEERKGRLLPILLLTSTAVAASLFIVTANETQWFIRENHSFVIENYFSGTYKNQPLDVKLTSGPLKGIYTNKRISTVYDAMLRDLDKIKEMTEPSDRVFVSNLAPLLYLHLDRTYATYSAWNRKDEIYRTEAYWKEHPDRLPDYIYLSYYDMFTYTPTEKLVSKELSEIWTHYFELEAINSETGEILRVTKWKPIS